jgi:hypothetical protein
MDDWGTNSTEVVFACKWRDGEKEQGLPPYEIVMTRVVTKKGDPVETYREVITHPADIRIAKAHADAGGVEIAQGRF